MFGYHAVHEFTKKHNFFGHNNSEDDLIVHHNYLQKDYEQQQAYESDGALGSDNQNKYISLRDKKLL